MLRAAALLLLVFVGRAAGEPVRGTRVEWARLRSPGAYWDRHAAFDRVFLEFLRAHTSIDIDVEPHIADPDSVDDLCRYPLLFVANLDDLDPPQRRNLAEYLHRGGFVLLDFCLEGTVHPRIGETLVHAARLVADGLNHLVLRRLPNDHPVFTSYFDLRTRLTDAQAIASGGQIAALGGLYEGTRLVGFLSMDALECDLAGFKRYAPPRGAAEVLTNLYLYALYGDRNLPPPPQRPTP